MGMGIHRIRRFVAAAVVAPLSVLALAAGDNGPVLVSLRTDGGPANESSYEASVSANGRVVAFRSYAANLTGADVGDLDRIFVRDVKAGTTTLVSALEGTPFADGSYNPMISGNGRYVLFQSYSVVFDPPDASGDSDLFLLDRKTQTLRIVGLNADGASGNDSVFFDGASFSANGRYAVAYSNATNLTGDPVGGLYEQIFYFDFRKQTVALVSKGIGGAPANNSCGRPSISANGRWVAFDSVASNMVPGVDNGTYQIYAWDARTGVLRHVSRASGGGESDGNGFRPAVSNNGVVAFGSSSSDLLPVADVDEDYDVFLFDPRGDGTMRKISVDAGGFRPDGSAQRCSISQNGKLVAFSTTQGLVSSDDNGILDIYAVDVPTGAIRLVTRDADGNSGNGASDLTAASLSANGRWLVYETRATNLADGDGNGTDSDVVVVDPRK